MDEVRNENERVAAKLRMQRYRARLRGEDVERRKPGPRPQPREAMIPAHPSADRGYAVDMATPLRHVVTELAEAGARGASVPELASSYTHTIQSDFSRVKLWHGLNSDGEAIRFLIDRAVSTLGVRTGAMNGSTLDGQLRHARGAGRYRLAVPADEVDFRGLAGLGH